MLMLITNSNMYEERPIVSWLNDNHLSYRQIDLATNTLSVNDVKYLLKISDAGFASLINWKVLEKMTLMTLSVFETTSVENAIVFVTKHPEILLYPMLIDPKKNILRTGKLTTDFDIFRTPSQIHQQRYSRLRQRQLLCQYEMPEKIDESHLHAPMTPYEYEHKLAISHLQNHELQINNYGRFYGYRQRQLDTIVHHNRSKYQIK